MAEAKIQPSILLGEEKPKEIWEIPDYSEDERKYLSNLQKKLENAKTLREQPFPEFHDMTYTQYWQKNEDLANTKLKAKINKQDVQYSSGTLRTKLFAFLSSLQGLNLSGDISAYNESDILMTTLGDALEDVIDKADELDEDEEKKLLRQYELLKQGHVFVEEIWDERWIVEKAPIENYTGKFRGIKIRSKEVKVPGKPVRNIICGLNVYLGDLRKYLISEQPYIFSVQTMRYEEAEKIYKNFEMWHYVSKTLKPWSGDTDKAMSQNAWRLMDTRENWVEIIKYQNKPDNEYQIVINGIPMLPIGFPFPWGYSEYNITQQNLKPIRHDFAYGISFIFETKNPIQLLDEFMKLALLKTQKSFLPPYLNISGRVISTKVLMPATISMGIPAGSLVPISEKEVQGVTPAEFNIIQELIRTIDINTASQTFTGAREQGEVTATQIVELQRQARIMMGVLIVTATLLEKKLITLRLMNILKKWFEPLDEVVDKARNALKARYRIISRMRNIEGEGPGIRMVVPTEELPTPEQLQATATEMKSTIGVPVRIIALNPKELAQAKLTWVVTVNPREKKSSELAKLMFRSMVLDARALGLAIDPEWLAIRFAEVWEEQPEKMFIKGGISPSSPTGSVTPPTKGEGTPVIKRPTIQLPSEGPTPSPNIL